MFKEIKIKNIFKTLVFLAVFVLIFSPFIVSAQAGSEPILLQGVQIGAQAGVEGPPAVADDTCVLNPLCYLNKWATDTWRGFLAGILGFFSFLPWATGSLLDFVIKMTIVDMTANVNAMSAINGAWAVLRDLANILFIFILLYVAIATVLQLQGANTKKVLTRVIVIALLINFSFFFTRVIIDVSNALSVGFYSAIVESSGGELSLASAYLDKLNVTTFYNDKGSGGPTVDLAKYPIVAFMGAIFFIVIALVFLAAVGLFVSRYVVLIFLMILSAPAFAAMALPNDKYSGKWWDALWSQVLFAPMFFILSWITLQILDNLLGSLVGGDGSLAKAITGSVDAAGNKTADPSAGAVFANFGIVIAFMIASLAIAKSLAGTAGKGVSNFVGGIVGGATVGAAGWVGRNTIGAWAQRDVNDKELNRKAAEGDIGARLQLAASKRIAKSSFDVRATGAGKELNLGKAGGKGGYAAFEKEEGKQTAEYIKKMMPSSLETFKAEQGLTQAREKILSSESGKSMSGLIVKRKEDVQNIQKKIDAQYKKGTESGATPEQVALSERLRKEGEAELKKAQSELERAQNQREQLISRGTEVTQSKLGRLKGFSKEDVAKGIAKQENISFKEAMNKAQPIEADWKMQQKAVMEKIGKQWWSQTRATRYNDAKKATKEKSKGEKAIEDYVKQLDEEREEGKEKGEKEEKTEKENKTE